jgi:hypothetical protein
MTAKFDNLYSVVLREANEDDSQLSNFGNPPEGDGQSPPQDGENPDEELAGLEAQLGEASAPPEEKELANLAIRALNFNSGANDVHQFKMTVNGQTIPFERIPDFFEQTKNWKAVLKFVEWVINKYEGNNSKWSEEQELTGKNIVSKIQELNKDKSDPSKLLDNPKRLTWARIILNALIHPDPSFNLSGVEVTDKNIKDIYNMMRLHFGQNTRGITNGEVKGPGNN